MLQFWPGDASMYRKKYINRTYYRIAGNQLMNWCIYRSHQPLIMREGNLSYCLYYIYSRQINDSRVMPGLCCLTLGLLILENFLIKCYIPVKVFVVQIKNFSIG